jgi:hypothetical protein
VLRRRAGEITLRAGVPAEWRVWGSSYTPVEQPATPACTTPSVTFAFKLRAAMHSATRLCQQSLRFPPRRVLRRQLHLQITPQQRARLPQVAPLPEVHLRLREQ